MAEGEGLRTIAPFIEYCDDKKDPDNYVAICVDIPKLKTKRFGKGASNADINFALTERSLCLTVKMLTTTKPTCYELKVERLPEDVIVDKSSYHKVKKGEVLIMLHKAKSCSWSHHLSASGRGLETAGEPSCS